MPLIRNDTQLQSQESLTINLLVKTPQLAALVSITANYIF